MENLAANDYVRERLEPRPGDPHYLALSDLLIALRSLLPATVSRVLDYGCGGSPYRPLFGDCVYHRADLSGQDLDFQYGADAVLPASAGGYDCVLSTQVLEHVERPLTYLQECYRVMKSNGQLLLTTHGLFEEHGCPYDYWRWTTFGLHRIIESSGFKVEAVKKITTGPRAALFLAEGQFYRFRSNPIGLYARALSLAIRGVQRFGAARLHAACDLNYPKNRVVEADEAGHEMYIGVAILATR